LQFPFSRVLAVNIGSGLDDGEAAGLFYKFKLGTSKFKLGHLGSKQYRILVGLYQEGPRRIEQ
jgi:hypothetical protein